ncbi:YIL082W-A-like protein, partial [Saccharomyces cerevisiae VL3]
MSFMDQIPGGGNYPKLPVECLPNFPIQPSLTFRGRNDSHKLKNFISEIMLNMSMISWPNDASRIVYCRRHLLNPAAQWANDFVQEQGILEITFDTFIQGLYQHFYKPPDINKIFNAITQLSEAKLGIERLNQRFRKIWDRMPPDFMTEKAAIMTYTRLLTKETYNIVRMHKPETLKDAMEEAYQTTALTERFFPGFELDADGDTIIGATTHLQEEYDSDYDSEDNLTQNRYVHAVRTKRSYNKPMSNHRNRRNNNPSREEC